MAFRPDYDVQRDGRFYIWETPEEVDGNRGFACFGATVGGLATRRRTTSMDEREGLLGRMTTQMPVEGMRTTHAGAPVVDELCS